MILSPYHDGAVANPRFLVLVFLTLLGVGAHLLADPPRAVPAERHAGSIAILSVRGVIDELTFASIVRRTDLATAQGAQAIVLEFDTPGGDLFATLQLCHYIKTQMPANTVAWIHPHAYSAGAILALATREILVSPDSAFGDAAPIQAVPGIGIIPLPQTERAKMEAPIIAEVIESARRAGYDENLVQSFVRLGSELWLIERTDESQRALVDAAEFEEVFGEAPPRQSIAVQPSSVSQEGDVTPPSPFFTQYRSKDVLEVPAPTVVPSRPRLDASQRGQWKLLSQIVKSDQLLVLHPHEARALGLARATIANDQELVAWFGANSALRYDESWSEHLVRFLISWPVRIALIVLMIVGFVLEGLSPGVGMFGSVAAIALLLLVGAPAFVGLAEWWELIAIVVGFALVALDVVVLPLGGWIACAGGALVLTGLVSSFVTRDLSSSVGQEQLFMGIGSTLAGLFGSAIALWFASKALPRSSFAHRAILQTVVAAGSNGQRPDDPRWPRPGSYAMTLTTLRPSGRVEIGGAPFDAHTTGEFVDAGERVRVIGRRGSTLEVIPIVGESTSRAPDESQQSTPGEVHQ